MTLPLYCGRLCGLAFQFQFAKLLAATLATKSAEGVSTQLTSRGSTGAYFCQLGLQASASVARRRFAAGCAPSGMPTALSLARAGMAFKSLTQQQRRAAASARAQHRQGMRAALVRPAQSEGRQAAGRSSSALHASPTWSSSPASTQEKQHQYTCALLFE